ncbi:amidase domain-containing protein [Streptomyces sp. NPDC058122]|uniref:amidase domain-containing protein n=1 Tax=Streptomyces sp. NPDC058122 TaxID=3346349 RepID=UPI0036E86A78
MTPKNLSRSCSVVGALTLSALLLPLSAAHAAAPAPRVTASTADAFGRVADAVFTDRTAALLETAPKARTALKATTSGIRVPGTLAHTETTAVSALHGTRSRLAALGEAYSAADTEVAVNRTRVTGRLATAWVTETTTLTYRKIRGDEPATTGFRAHHVLTFAAQADGTWKLTGERSTDKGPRQINQPVTTKLTKTTMAAVDAPRAATTYPAPANPKTLTGGPYDYAAMATYAETYWKNYNPAYRSFNSVGGDCTNYVSQSLKAGGWATVASSGEEYGTWNYTASTQTDTWVGVNELSWFTQTAHRSTPLANVYQMDVGDVMQMDFDKDGSKDHSMITSYRSGGGVPYLTYHDTDTYRRSLSSLLAAYPNAAYYGYRT